MRPTIPKPRAEVRLVQLASRTRLSVLPEKLQLLRSQVEDRRLIALLR